jgi:hypothetical protein
MSAAGLSCQSNWVIPEIAMTALTAQTVRAIDLAPASRDRSLSNPPEIQSNVFVGRASVGRKAGIENKVNKNETGMPMAAKVPISESPGKSLSASARKATVVVKALSIKEGRRYFTIARGPSFSLERAW